MPEKTLQEMMPLADVLNKDIVCSCGRTHRADIDEVVIGRGAMEYLPELLDRHGIRTVFMLEDTHTHEAAGAQAAEIMRGAGYTVYEHIYEREGWLPADEKAMDEGVEAFNGCEARPDVIISVGSGTLNDLGKVIGHMLGGVPQWIVGTAASMDGYASTVAALVRNNMKVTEYYAPPKVIIGDLAVMSKAPRKMTLAGIADMMAKYNAGLDWKLSRLINGEYYCDFIAEAMLKVTDMITELALEAPEEGEFGDELLGKIMEGLVLSGIYMSYMGTSRAASGSEHHFSHFWEMWLQLNNKPAIYHGTKVGVGALMMDRVYRKFLDLDIETRRVIPRLERFDEESYKKTIQKVYGAAAPEILKDYKFDAPTRIERLKKIVKNRRQINGIIRTELPRLDRMRQALKHTGAVMDYTGLPYITGEIAKQALLHCKEMRKHYTMLQILTDCGVNLESLFPLMQENGYLSLSQIQMRDPFILPVAEQKKYYLFGTTGPDCWRGPYPGLDCYESEDLEHWYGPMPAFRPAEDFWGTRNFWAPEVHAYRGKYYMFVTFGSETRRKGTQILRADKPEGPYEPISEGPVTPADWECLDGTFYEDPKGQPWIVFCHEWSQVIDGEICAMPLTSDLSAPAGEPILLFHASDASWAQGRPWKERDPKTTLDALSYVTDGPFLVKEGRNLIMLWSGRGPKGYAMGSAVSKSGILGPWKQNEQLAFEEDGGHGMVFKDWNGKYWMTVHQPNRTPSERPVLVPATVKGGVITIKKATSKEEPEMAEKEEKKTVKKTDEPKPEKEQKPAQKPVQEQKGTDSGKKQKDELPVWLL